MKLEDAIFNWLQISAVHEIRPDDLSAKDTVNFFNKILFEDLNLKNVRYERGPLNYTVFYEHDGKEEKKIFDIGLVNKLLQDIENEPKFN